MFGDSLFAEFRRAVAGVVAESQQLNMQPRVATTNSTDSQSEENLVSGMYKYYFSTIELPMVMI